MVALGGCLADDPHTGKLDLDPAPDGYWLPDSPTGCPTIPTTKAPVLDTYPNPTAYGLQPFRGKAIGAAKIYAQGGSGAAQPVIVNSDGSFCIEVQLLLDSPNNITFTPLDKKGCVGTSTTISITHKSTPKLDAGMPTIQNVAKGQTVDQQYMDSGSQISYVVDGDATSYAKFSFFDTGTKYAYVRVDLGKSYTISKFKIRWPSSVGSDYAKEYAVLISTKSAPVSPDPTQVSDWKTIKSVSNGDATDQTIPISPESARWAALLMYENGGTYVYETFLLAEFEVWGQDPNAQPPPPPDRCD